VERFQGSAVIVCAFLFVQVGGERSDLMPWQSTR